MSKTTKSLLRFCVPLLLLFAFTSSAVWAQAAFDVNGTTYDETEFQAAIDDATDGTPGDLTVLRDVILDDAAAAGLYTIAADLTIASDDPANVLRTITLDQNVDLQGVGLNLTLNEVDIAFPGTNISIRGDGTPAAPTIIDNPTVDAGGALVFQGDGRIEGDDEATSEVIQVSRLRVANGAQMDFFNSSSAVDPPDRLVVSRELWVDGTVDMRTSHLSYGVWNTGTTSTDPVDIADTPVTDTDGNLIDPVLNVAGSIEGGRLFTVNVVDTGSNFGDAFTVGGGGEIPMDVLVANVPVRPVIPAIDTAPDPNETLSDRAGLVFTAERMGNVTIEAATGVTNVTVAAADNGDDDGQNFANNNFLAAATTEFAGLSNASLEGNVIVAAIASNSRALFSSNGRITGNVEVNGGTLRNSVLLYNDFAIDGNVDVSVPGGTQGGFIVGQGGSNNSVDVNVGGNFSFDGGVVRFANTDDGIVDPDADPPNPLASSTTAIGGEFNAETGGAGLQDYLGQLGSADGSGIFANHMVTVGGDATIDFPLDDDDANTTMQGILAFMSDFDANAVVDHEGVLMANGTSTQVITADANINTEVLTVVNDRTVRLERDTGSGVLTIEDTFNLTEGIFLNTLEDALAMSGTFTVLNREEGGELRGFGFAEDMGPIQVNYLGGTPMTTGVELDGGVQNMNVEMGDDVDLTLADDVEIDGSLQILGGNLNLGQYEALLTGEANSDVATLVVGDAGIQDERQTNPNFIGRITYAGEDLNRLFYVNTIDVETAGFAWPAELDATRDPDGDGDAVANPYLDEVWFRPLNEDDAHGTVTVSGDRKVGDLRLWTGTLDIGENVLEVVDDIDININTFGDLAIGTTTLEGDPEGRYDAHLNGEGGLLRFVSDASSAFVGYVNSDDDDPDFDPDLQPFREEIVLGPSIEVAKTDIDDDDDGDADDVTFDFVQNGPEDTDGDGNEDFFAHLKTMGSFTLTSGEIEDDDDATFATNFAKGALVNSGAPTPSKSATGGVSAYIDIFTVTTDFLVNESAFVANALRDFNVGGNATNQADGWVQIEAYRNLVVGGDLTNNGPAFWAQFTQTLVDVGGNVANTNGSATLGDPDDGTDNGDLNVGGDVTNTNGALAFGVGDEAEIGGNVFQTGTESDVIGAEATSWIGDADVVNIAGSTTIESGTFTANGGNVNQLPSGNALPSSFSTTSLTIGTAPEDGGDSTAVAKSASNHSTGRFIAVGGSEGAGKTGSYDTCFDGRYFDGDGDRITVSDVFCASGLWFIGLGSFDPGKVSADHIGDVTVYPNREDDPSTNVADKNQLALGGVWMQVSGDWHFAGVGDVFNDVTTPDPTLQGLSGVVSFVRSEGEPQTVWQRQDEDTYFSSVHVNTPQGIKLLSDLWANQSGTLTLEQGNVWAMNDEGNYGVHLLNPSNEGLFNRNNAFAFQFANTIGGPIRQGELAPGAAGTAVENGSRQSRVVGPVHRRVVFGAATGGVVGAGNHFPVGAVGDDRGTEDDPNEVDFYRPLNLQFASDLGQSSIASVYTMPKPEDLEIEPFAVENAEGPEGLELNVLADQLWKLEFDRIPAEDPNLRVSYAGLPGVNDIKELRLLQFACDPEDGSVGEQLGLAGRYDIAGGPVDDASFFVNDFVNGVPNVTQEGVEVLTCQYIALASDELINPIVDGELPSLARVQFINNSADAGAVDIYVNDRRVVAADDLPYLDYATPYVTVEAGDVRIDVVDEEAEDNSDPIFSQTVTLDENDPDDPETSHVIAFNGSVEDGDANLALFREAREVARNDSQVEFIVLHGSPDAGNVNFHIVDETPQHRMVQLLGNDITFGEFTNYQGVDPTAYNVAVFDSDNNPLTDPVPTFRFKLGAFEGETATFLTSGKLANDNLHMVGFDAEGERITNGVVTDVDEPTPEELPTEFALDGNYPNPFNPSTTIQYDLPATAEVTIEVIDMLGRQVMTLTPGTVEAGANRTAQVSASHMASGMYLYRVIAKMADETKVKTGRMTLVK